MKLSGQPQKECGFCPLGDLRGGVRVDLTILALGLDLESFPKFPPTLSVLPSAKLPSPPL